MTHQSSKQRAKEFLANSGQFRLGALTTESSHPITANLSEVAENDISAALDLLFEVDGDVVRTYRKWVESDEALSIKNAILASIKNGGRIIFTGCGATGRLSIQLVSIWRDFWQQQGSDLEDRALSVMAGGDFALIKSVEGFEDFTQFGAKQIEDLNVSAKDIVFAITEGGETSFVIGTAWKALASGARVYYIYNNPDDVLCKNVRRSREVIEEPLINKINLTTGPMAITGSTRMQATSIQLCVMLTVLEMVVRDLLSIKSESVPEEFLKKLEEMHTTLRSADIRDNLAKLVALEESVYRSDHKNNYFADYLAIDVLTDTTERSPTFCTPSFRKHDEQTASESWSFLFLPQSDSVDAWEYLLKRKPRAVEWSLEQVNELVGDALAEKQYGIMQKISLEEIYKFKFGLDGLKYRLTNSGDSAIGIVAESDIDDVLKPDGFIYTQLHSAAALGAKTGLIVFDTTPSPGGEGRGEGANYRNLSFINELLIVPVPQNDFLLNGITRIGAKMLMNALSTCTMVRLGRVMGNYMIYVVPSNLKLIDRAARYISKLTGLSYEDSCYLLFEVIEYIEPRMLANQAYPPVVGVAVMRAKYGSSNEDAEQNIEDFVLKLL